MRKRSAQAGLTALTRRMGRIRRRIARMSWWRRDYQAARFFDISRGSSPRSRFDHQRADAPCRQNAERDRGLETDFNATIAQLKPIAGTAPWRRNRTPEIDLIHLPVGMRLSERAESKACSRTRLAEAELPLASWPARHRSGSEAWENASSALLRPFWLHPWSQIRL